MSEEMDRIIATEFFDWTPRCPGSGYAPRTVHTYTIVEGSEAKRFHTCPDCYRMFAAPGDGRDAAVPEHERTPPPYSSDIRWAVLVLVELFDRGHTVRLELHQPEPGDPLYGARISIGRKQHGTDAIDTSSAGALAICQTAIRSIHAPTITT